MTSGDADAMSWLTENVSPLPGHGGMGTEDGFEAESVRPRSFTPLTALRARALREQLDDGRMVSAAGASPPSTLLQQDINRLQTAFRSSLQGEGFKTPAKASGAMDRALEVVSAVENVARHVSGSERTPSYVHRTRDRQLRDMGLKKEALDLPAEPFDAWLRRADPASIIGPAARRELGKLWEAADENKVGRSNSGASETWSCFLVDSKDRLGFQSPPRSLLLHPPSPTTSAPPPHN